MMRRGDAAGAAAEYRKCLAGDAENDRARADLALALGAMGLFAESDVEFQAALRLNPRDAVTHANYGRVLAVQRKFDAARAELERALKLDPEQPLARDAMRKIGPGPGR
jgi:Tfp pilus assembly protein PilF